MVLSFLLRYDVFRIKFVRPFVNGGLFLVIMNKGFVLREMISCDILAIFILTIPKMEDSWMAVTQAYFTLEFSGTVFLSMFT